jgi:hypothetical protein
LTVGQDSVVMHHMMGDWRPNEAYLKYQLESYANSRGA